MVWVLINCPSGSNPKALREFWLKAWYAEQDPTLDAPTRYRLQSERHEAYRRYMQLTQRK